MARRGNYTPVIHRRQAPTVTYVTFATHFLSWRLCDVVLDAPGLWTNPHSRGAGVGRSSEAPAMGDELAWPLRGWEAVEAGLMSVRELRRFYVPVYPGVH